MIRILNSYFFLRLFYIPITVFVFYFFDLSSFLNRNNHIYIYKKIIQDLSKSLTRA